MRYLVALLLAPALFGQTRGGCSCGSNPPGPPVNRIARPYAGAPNDMRPFSKFTAPYFEHYTNTVEYNGAAREVPTLKASDVDEVRIGFLGPVEDHPDQPLGVMMLAGARMAIDEANAAGGYCGKPFRLMVHNDQAVWGAASNEIVRMTYDEKVWAMFGSISGDSTHIALRVTLKTEVPIVNSAATDPTIPETIIPWYLTTIQDDRVQCYTLARRIYTDLGLKKVALLRVNDRYGRFGVLKFKDASRRLGHPVVIEQKYLPGDTDFSRQLRVIAASGVDAVVLWGDAAPAGNIVKQMRAAGMTQRVFGSFRVLGDDLVRLGGAAAEGVEIVYPFDASREDPLWKAFSARYAKQHGKSPEAFAALAFDTMNILIESICRGGLNRGRIRDALANVERYRGVTGEMAFDPNFKNVMPMFLATIRNGKPEFRRYPMTLPYATVHESAPAYHGPALPDAPAGSPTLVVFGPGADKAAVALAQHYSGRFQLSGVPSELPWSEASSRLVKLIYDKHALAIVATDRNSAHLAEQLAVKAFVPVVATSDDRDLSAVNIPWLFRLPASTSADDALRMLAAAAESSGANRERLRAALERNQLAGK